MSDLCAVTADLLARDRREAADAKRERYIDLEVERMTSPGGEYDPTDTNHFAEALIQIEQHPIVLVALHALIVNRKFGEAGQKLDAYVRGYWTAHARRQAQEAAEKATCQHCFDIGCRRCNSERNF